MRFIYVNGKYVRPQEAMVSVNDRGYQFGDGIYDVVALKDNRWVNPDEHLERFQSALKTMQIHFPYPLQFLKTIAQELWRREQSSQGLLYTQITRGVANRVHTFPKTPIQPSLVMYLKSQPVIVPNQMMKVVTLDDWRSGLCFIKSTALLPNIMAKQKAYEQGADEVLFVKDGLVREGSTANFFAVKQGALYTAPDDGTIVAGVSRRIVMNIARDLKIPCHEAAISVEDIFTADELFFTHTSNGIRGISQVNGTEIHGGSMGPLTKKLFDRYLALALSQPLVQGGV